MTLATAAATVLQVFRDAGVRATDDAREINPPCVYLLPPQGAFQFGKGVADVTWTAYLVTGNVGARAATAALSDLVDAVRGTSLALTTFTRAGLPLPGGGDPMPAFEITWKSRETIGA